MQGQESPAEWPAGRKKLRYSLAAKHGQGRFQILLYIEGRFFGKSIQTSLSDGFHQVGAEKITHIHATGNPCNVLHPFLQIFLFLTMWRYSVVCINL